MSGYTKLFSSILASTVWREDKDTRIVWITLLAMADRNGMAEGSIPGLADFARLSVDETRKALIKLESPDPDSRTQVDEGRRIRTVDGGWLLVNHAKYRAKMNEDDRREYKRVKQAQYRAEDDAGPVDTSGQVLTGVDNGGQPLTVLPNVTQAEAEATPSPKAKAENVPAADAAVPPRFEEFWAAYPKKRDKGHAEKAFKALRVSDGLLSIMLSALEHQCRMTDWTKDGGKFIPLAATWLHGHRWDDEIGMGTDPERDRKLGPSYTPGDWWLSCRHEPKCETGPMHRQREGIDAARAAR
jgi:hypothetical protein